MMYKPIPVKDGDKVKVRKKKRFPYVEMLSILLQGEDFFLEVDRKMAYYLKRRLNDALEEIGIDSMIEAYPTTYAVEEDGKSVEKDGYVFRMVRWRGEGKVWIEKEKLIGEIKKRMDKATVELKQLELQPPDKSLAKIKALLKTRIETFKEIIDLIEKI